MTKKMILHDLEKENTERFLKQIPKDWLVFEANPMVKHCVGCFNCWIKTPGQCVIADRARIAPKMLANSSEFIIISKLRYGGFSAEIKTVLDRSIGYMMPFFRIVNGEMHHTMRYRNPFKLNVHFYDDEGKTATRELAKKLVVANGINLGASETQVTFHQAINDIEKVF